MNEGVWTWRDGVFTDPLGTVAATLRSDIIRVGDCQLLTEIHRDARVLRLKATASDGQIFIAEQAGFSLTKLAANCAGRRYRLERTRRFRRERVILDAAGRVVARTRPHQDALEVFDHLDDANVPDVDVVFLTWACVEADNSGRVRI
ncbi:hypothetical protein [uncultured Corynebacterium sp.]|uniref:hypothetical protein n=1 Tax=uncultured Corynebacterium sp. TaxID=159447 RepID=UPI0025D292E4|nr:hypothetical protein [uncultured Corynebacterium sp.]